MSDPGPAANAPFAVLGRRRGMNQTDRVLLGIGVTIAALAGLCLLILFPVLGGASAAAATLVLLIGMGGAGLTAFALRRQLPVACGVGAGIVVLLLLGVLVSARSGGGKPSSIAQSPPSAAAAPGTVPALSPSVGTTVPTASPPLASPPVTSPPAMPPSDNGSPFVPLSLPSAPADSRSPFVPMDSASPFVPVEPSSPQSSPQPSAPSSPSSAAGTGSNAIAAPASPSLPSMFPPTAAIVPGSAGAAGGTSNALAAPLPAAVAAALDSTVLVEHTLGSGSGFAVAKNVVATNAHVVEGAFPDEIKVKCGKENNVAQRISRVLHFDRARDLCLLEGEMDLTGLTVRPDYELKSGDSVVLMGNPSVRGGILMRNVTNRGKLRTLVHIEGQDLYHIDADVNPGWSGGPILDMEGQVIAVVVMKANDSAAAEIRGAMRKLDDSFRAANTPTQGGITYGIPGSALARVLNDGSFKDTTRRTLAHDRYVAQTVVARMNALAGLAMLRMQANVPVQVRVEADAMAKGALPMRTSRFSTVKVEYVALLPEEVCRALTAFLRSRKVRELEDNFRKNLDARLDNVAESEHVADEVKRDLKTLTKKIKDASAYADRPGVTYAAYSIKVSGFTRDLRELVDRLEKKVDQSEP